MKSGIRLLALGMAAHQFHRQETRGGGALEMGALSSNRDRVQRLELVAKTYIEVRISDVAILPSETILQTCIAGGASCQPILVATRVRFPRGIRFIYTSLNGYGRQICYPWFITRSWIDQMP